MYTVDGVADILSRCDDHREGQEDHRGDAPGVHGDHDDDLNGDDDGGEEMVIRRVKTEIIKTVKLISPSIYFFHKKSLYFFPCSENEKVKKIMFFSPVESEHTGVDVNV